MRTDHFDGQSYKFVIARLQAVAIHDPRIAAPRSQ
jgi:hypothetical protein